MSQRYANRVDANQRQLTEFFEAHGCVVESLAHAGRGLPDILVGYAPTSRVAVVEIKAPKGRTKPRTLIQQEKFRAKFPMTFVVRDDTTALRVILWLKHRGTKREVRDE